MSDDDWESFRDGELSPSTAERLATGVRANRVNMDLVVQRGLTAWSAACRAGDVKRAFLARVAAESHVRPVRLASQSSGRGSGSGSRHHHSSGTHRVRTTRTYRRRRSQQPAQGWIAAIAAGMMVVVGGWVLMTSPTPHSAPNPGVMVPESLSPPTAPLPQSTTSAEFVQILAASPGLVMVADRVIPAPSPYQTLPARTALTVGAGGEATLKIGASQVIVGHPSVPTTVQWSLTAAEQLRWQLDYGSLEFSVIRADADPFWSVQMPQAEIAVVGTVFTVHAARDHWSVAVQQGAVSANPKGGIFKSQHIGAGMTMVGADQELRLLPHADATARRAVLITDKWHPDDAAAISHALLSPDLQVVAIVTAWEETQQAEVATWCRALTAAIGRDRVHIANGLDGPLSEIVVPPSTAVNVLRQAAELTTATEPLLVISLGTSRTVIAEVLRHHPEVAQRIQLIELGFGSDQPYGRGRDPVADAICDASGLRRVTAPVYDPASLVTWPEGPLGAVLASSGTANSGVQVDVVGVHIAEQLARSRTLPERTTSAELIAAITARWRQRGPRVLTP